MRTLLVFICSLAGAFAQIVVDPTNALALANASNLTNTTKDLAIYVSGNYTVSAADTNGMMTTNFLYAVDSNPGSVTFTFPPAFVNTFYVLNMGTNTVALTAAAGNTFQIYPTNGGTTYGAVLNNNYAGKVQQFRHLRGSNYVVVGDFKPLLNELFNNTNYVAAAATTAQLNSASNVLRTDIDTGVTVANTASNRVVNAENTNATQTARLDALDTRALTNAAAFAPSGSYQFATSFQLTNLLAIGITNIVTVNGVNEGIGTNSGTLWITNVVYQATNSALSDWQKFSTNVIANAASNLVVSLGSANLTVSLTSTNGTNFFTVALVATPSVTGLNASGTSTAATLRATSASFGGANTLAQLTVTNSTASQLAMRIDSIGTNDLLRVFVGTNRIAGVTTNGFGTWATNFTATIANTAGATNTGQNTEVWRIAGTSGTYIFFMRGGGDGSTPTVIPLYTNTVLVGGVSEIVGPNCGIRFVTGVGTAISRRAF